MLITDLSAASTVPVTEPTEVFDIQIMPNPASTTLQVIIDEYHNFEKHLHLFNTAGQLLLQKSWADAKTELSISHLPQGVYFIKMVIIGQIQTKKIVIFR